MLTLWFQDLEKASTRQEIFWELPNSTCNKQTTIFLWLSLANNKPTRQQLLSEPNHQSFQHLILKVLTSLEDVSKTLSQLSQEVPESTDRTDLVILYPLETLCCSETAQIEIWPQELETSLITKDTSRMDMFMLFTARNIDLLFYSQRKFQKTIHKIFVYHINIKILTDKNIIISKREENKHQYQYSSF